MDRSRVERGETDDLVEGQQESKLGASEDHAINAFALAESFNDGDHAIANVLAKNALDHFIHVVLMNEGALCFVRDDGLDLELAESVGVHRRFHRESRSEEGDASQSATPRLLRTRRNDADERNR